MIEIAEFVNRRTVEKAYRAVLVAQSKRDNSLAAKGWRAAVDRNPRLLRALEGGAEILHMIAEEQSGRTRRDAGTAFAERVDPTESSLWREAYRTCDEGKPVEPLSWIYAAGALLAGIIY